MPRLPCVHVYVPRHIYATKDLSGKINSELVVKILRHAPRCATRRMPTQRKAAIRFVDSTYGGRESYSRFAFSRRPAYLDLKTFEPRCEVRLDGLVQHCWISSRPRRRWLPRCYYHRYHRETVIEDEARRQPPSLRLLQLTSLHLLQQSSLRLLLQPSLRAAPCEMGIWEIIDFASLGKYLFS